MFFEGSLRQRRLLQRSKLAKLVTSSMHKAYSLEKTQLQYYSYYLFSIPITFKGFRFTPLVSRRRSARLVAQSRPLASVCRAARSKTWPHAAWPCRRWLQGPPCIVAISSPEISVNLMDLRFIMIYFNIFQASRVNQAESFGATAIWPYATPSDTVTPV